MMKTAKIIASVLIFLIFLNVASALTINSVDADTLAPGQEGKISINLENTLGDTVNDISLKLNMENLPFNPVGSSESSLDELDEDDDESFYFTIKSANDIKPGDYKIPFTLTYTINDAIKQKTGTIGITLRANPEIIYSISQEKPIMGQSDKITLKLINKGFADAKFALIKVFPDGYTLTSDNEIYICSVDSDDFQTASFDVTYTEKNPVFSATIEYKDFDNKKKLETISLPLTIYTQEEAIKLGLISKNNTGMYITIIILLIIIWFVYRAIRKRVRARNKQRR